MSVRGVLVSTRPTYLVGGAGLYAIGLMLGADWPAERFAAIDWMGASLGLAAVTLVHTITHLINDAEDVETDELCVDPTMFSGGSRAIQRGLTTPSQLRRVSAILAALVGVTAILAALRGDWLAAGLFIAMLALGYSYSGPPLMLGRRGLGELDAAIVMGLLVPAAGACASGGFSPTLSVAVLLAVETAFARLCTAFPDIEADRATGKWTIPALLGPRKSALAFAAVALLILAVGIGLWPERAAAEGRLLASLVTSLAAVAIAALIATERLGSKTILVPLLGLGAYSLSQLIIVVALW